MPLFTKFKKAKDAADEHKKTTAIEQAKPPAPPYRHVPTHAKQDALAVQPTTVRPEELQARIAAARKKRAASSQSSVSVRHSVYHSCESSRSSSRASSAIRLPPYSKPPSQKSRERSAESIDTILKRSQTISQMPSLPASNIRPQSKEGHDPTLHRLPTLQYPASQRPRSVPSRRSSFTKKKSPLSSVSVEEEPDEFFSNSSDTSNASTQSSSTTNSCHDDRKEKKASADSEASHVIQQSKPVVLNTPKPADLHPLVRRKSRWSLFQRKSVAVMAH